jgi:hypothetical protein
MFRRGDFEPSDAKPLSLLMCHGFFRVSVCAEVVEKSVNRGRDAVARIPRGDHFRHRRKIFSE